MIAGILALAVAAFYAGAALYVNMVELPAMAALDDRAQLAGWKVSLKRGFLIQAPLCLIGFLLGLVAWIETRLFSDAIGAVAMLANVPWTFAMVVPTNKALSATAPERAGPYSRALIKRWGSLHSVRTAFGLLALIAFLQSLLPR
jgi:Anthrone oxygenase